MEGLKVLCLEVKTDLGDHLKKNYQLEAKEVYTFS